MTTHEIAAALAELANALPGPKSKNPRAGLNVVSEYLSAQANIPLAEYIEAIVSTSKLQTSTVPKPTKKKPSVANDAIVEKYIAELRRVETVSVEDFGRVLKELSDDKKVRLIELKQICALYTGDPSALSSKAAAYGRISQSFDYRWKLANRS